MRGVIIGAVAAVFVITVLVGCSKSKGNVRAVFTWPTFIATSSSPLASMYSLKLEVLGKDAPSPVIINRPLGGGQSVVPYKGIPEGEYAFLATAYGALDAGGKILGQTYGTVRVVKDESATVYITAVTDPQARLLVIPEQSKVYIGDAVALYAAVVNPDRAFVITPVHFTWKSDAPEIAGVSAKTGEVSGLEAGTAQIRVTSVDDELCGSAQVRVVHRPPTVTLTADPTRVRPGYRTRLTWHTTGADRVIDTDGFSIRQRDHDDDDWRGMAFAPTVEEIIREEESSNDDVLNGWVYVRPRESTTYRMTVAGPGGVASDSVTVYINYPKPDVEITASRTSIRHGESVVLEWESDDATTVVRSENFNTTALNGFTRVYPNTTTTYRITVRGPGGEDWDSITVYVDKKK